MPNANTDTDADTNTYRNPLVSPSVERRLELMEERMEKLLVQVCARQERILGELRRVGDNTISNTQAQRIDADSFAEVRKLAFGSGMSFALSVVVIAIVLMWVRGDAT